MLVLADAVTSNGAKPSAGTALKIKLDMISFRIPRHLCRLETHNKITCTLKLITIYHFAYLIVWTLIVVIPTEISCIAKAASSLKVFKDTFVTQITGRPCAKAVIQNRIRTLRLMLQMAMASISLLWMLDHFVHWVNVKVSNIVPQSCLSYMVRHVTGSPSYI